MREAEGHYSDALRWFTRGLRTLETLDDAAKSENRLRLSLGYAGIRFRQGALADCVQWCERAVEEARGAGALAQLAHAYYLLHLAYTSLGSPERTRVRDLALPIYEELGDLLGQANTLNNLGIDAYYEGRWDDALDYYERSRRARERIGDVVGAATIANNIAETLSDQGLYEEAETLFEQVDETCTAAGSLLMTAVVDGNLGRLAARKGRHDEARRLLTTALAAFREIDAAAFVLEMQARLAEAAVLAGDHVQALRDAEVAELTSEVAAPPPLQAMLHRVRGYAHLQAGRPRGRGAGLRAQPRRRAERRRALRGRALAARAVASHAATPPTPPRRSGFSTRCTSCACPTSRSKREPSPRRARPRRSRRRRRRDPRRRPAAASAGRTRSRSGRRRGRRASRRAGGR